MVVAALAAGGATALGVSACGSSNSSSKSASSAVVSAPTTTAATVTPPKPTTIRVTVNGSTVTVRLSRLGFDYCRANPRTCAAIKSSQLKLLTQNQKNAVKAAQAKVRADEAAANQPAPAPAPVPQPAPAPEPPPSNGGGTTTG
jgi:hypothetical protein